MFGFTICSTALLQKLKAENVSNTSVLVDVKSFVLEIERGNLDMEITDNLHNHSIGPALLLVKESLKRIANQDYERNWITKGIANFTEILRDTSDIKAFANRIISYLVKYLEFNQGSFYIDNKDEAGNTFLQLYGCYAYQKTKFHEQHILPGEGLAGTCFIEKSSIYLTDIPKDYVTITSGLGEATPSNVFICPLVLNGIAYGVIELASFTLIKDFQRAFIEKISESIAAAIANVKSNAHTNQLLIAAQYQSEILATQEEEMRQNMEEMAATQEELQRRNLAFQAKEDELQQIMAEMKANEEDMQKTQDSHRKLMKEHLILKKEFAAITNPDSNNSTN